jgi:hypothetical protein
MPVYQYKNLRTGLIEEHVRSVAQRDSIPPGLERITVPARVAIHGTSSCPSDPLDADTQVRRAYRQLEEKSGKDECIRNSGFTVDQIKSTWGI